MKFISAEHERTVMISYPKLWKQIVKKFGHHPNFTYDGISRLGKGRRVGGRKQQGKRRVLKHGRK